MAGFGLGGALAQMDQARENKIDLDRDRLRQDEEMGMRRAQFGQQMQEGNYRLGALGRQEKEAQRADVGTEGLGRFMSNPRDVGAWNETMKSLGAPVQLELNQDGSYTEISNGQRRPGPKNAAEAAAILQWASSNAGQRQQIYQDQQTAAAEAAAKQREQQFQMDKLIKQKELERSGALERLGIESNMRSVEAQNKNEYETNKMREQEGIQHRNALAQNEATAQNNLNKEYLGSALNVWENDQKAQSESQYGTGSKPTNSQKKYQEMLQLGVPEDVAKGVSYGTFKTVTDSNTNQTVVVDLTTRKVIGRLAPVDQDNPFGPSTWQPEREPQGPGNWPWSGALGRMPSQPQAMPQQALQVSPQPQQSAPQNFIPQDMTIGQQQPPALPPQALSQLKEGSVVTFNNGQRWTLRNGQPERVQ